MSSKKEIVNPTLEQLHEIAKQANLGISEEEMKEYKELIDGNLEIYRKLDEVDVLHPVKYPRTSGYRPTKEENPLNAWWYKTDIKGAPTGKLEGKRVGIKDNIMVAGVPMINGSELMEGFIPNEDATIVTRILDEGGYIIGKTNCENLCWSGSSISCAAGPVLNPHDNSRSSGGSSSGNAVLLQQGEIDMSVGSDQAGSVRVPSSWCGIVGLKPTHGLVPYTGAMSMEPMTDHLGPMASNVTDCALLLEIIAGYDNGNDYRQNRSIVVPEYSKMLTGDISGMKIAVLTDGYEGCEPDVIEIIKASIKQFELKCGVITEEVSIPDLQKNFRLLHPASFLGMYHTVQNGGAAGVKGHQNIGCIDHMREALLTKGNVLPAVVKYNLLIGNYITNNHGVRFMAKAHNLLPRFVKEYNDVLNKYEVILMPTCPYKAAKFPQSGCSIKEYYQHCFRMLRNTAWFNLSGHPALSINAGFSEGLPIGLQIVGKHWDEATVLNVAYAFEQNISVHLKKN